MAVKSQYQADIKRIAQVLNVEEAELHYLNSLSAQDRDTLYRQVEASVSGEQSPLWPALAKSVRFFPNRLCAKITQEAFGPYIAAQMTSHLDTKTAIGIGKHFSTHFLAEVFLHVEAVKASSLLAKWPMAHLNKAVLFLLAEQQFEQIGGLLEHLPKDRVLALVREIDSPQAVMKIADSVKQKSRLAEALIQLKDDVLARYIEAASDLGLWETALLMCSHLNTKQQNRIHGLALHFEWDDERVFTELAENLGISEQLSALFGLNVSDTPLPSLGRLLPLRGLRKKRPV